MGGGGGGVGVGGGACRYWQEGAARLAGDTAATNQRVLCCAGPVDGPAIFESCSNCQVAVACHLFKANACTDTEFGEWGGWVGGWLGAGCVVV